MSEYKIDFYIPAMRQDQLKEFKPNILRAVVILVSAVLTSFVAIRFFAPFVHIGRRIIRSLFVPYGIAGHRRIQI